MIHRTEELTTLGKPTEALEPYEAFLQQLSVKGRATIEKREERDPEGRPAGSGELWKRMAGLLGTLAGHATEVSGQKTVKFHIPDGKYKLQVFALEETPGGTVAVYFPDVLKQAMKRSIVSAGAKLHDYNVRGSEEPLHLEPINAENKDLGACKAMVGWGRQALRAELRGSGDEKQVAAVEMLTRLAAENWARPAE